MSWDEAVTLMYGPADASTDTLMGLQMSRSVRDIDRHGHPVRAYSSKRAKKRGMLVDAGSKWFKQQFPDYWVQDAS